jgi:hypothetical protein
MSKNDEKPEGRFEAGNGTSGPDSAAPSGIKIQIRELTHRQLKKLIWRHNQILAQEAFGGGPPTQTSDPTLDAIDAQLKALSPAERDELLKGAAKSATQ